MQAQRLTILCVPLNGAPLRDLMIELDGLDSFVVHASPPETIEIGEWGDRHPLNQCGADIRALYPTALEALAARVDRVEITPRGVVALRAVGPPSAPPRYLRYPAVLDPGDTLEDAARVLVEAYDAGSMVPEVWAAKYGAEAYRG